MIETQENKVCPICQRPKRGGAAGSITQWISVCRCNIQDSQLNLNEEIMRVCADCRKRVNSAKGGTITQWIFSENFCKCANPRLVPVGPDDLEFKSFNEIHVDEQSYDEDSVLDVDPAMFPLERYKPLQLVGKGALGEVYLCQDVYLKKKVAVKCLLNLAADGIMSFQNEARIASKLNHESVISVMDFGTTSGGRPFMVMEYFPGKSLQDILAESGKIDEVDAIELFAPICRSLRYLHESGVLHRDLKPSNVLISVRASGAVDVRLIDFGLSQTTQDVQSKTLVNGHTIIGTPNYMSPDQIQGRNYDARSEVYSLGCMMFETVTGRQPFAGDSSLEVLNNHVHKPVPSVYDFEPAVSVELCELIEKCLSKEGNDRFKSVSELETALSSCRRTRTLEDSSSDAALAAAQGSETPSPFASQSSGRSLGWVIAVVCILAALPITFVCWSALKPSESTVSIPVARKSLAIPADSDTAKKAAGDASNHRKNDYDDLSTSRQALLDVDELDPSHAVPPPSKVGVDVVLNNGPVAKQLKDFDKTPLKNPKVKLQGNVIVHGDGSLIASLNPVEVSLLDCSGVTDDTMNELSKASRIEKLTLDGSSQITPKGFKCLEKMPNLTFLSLNRCNMNDNKIRALSGMKKLEFVSLNQNVHITSVGLIHLGGKPHLVNINVDLGGIGPGQKKEIEVNGVRVFYNRSNFNESSW